MWLSASMFWSLPWPLLVVLFQVCPGYSWTRIHWWNVEAGLLCPSRCLHSHAGAGEEPAGLFPEWLRELQWRRLWSEGSSTLTFCQRRGRILENPGHGTTGFSAGYSMFSQDSQHQGGFWACPVLCADHRAPTGWETQWSHSEKVRRCSVEAAGVGSNGLASLWPIFPINKHSSSISCKLE